MKENCFNKQNRYFKLKILTNSLVKRSRHCPRTKLGRGGGGGGGGGGGKKRALLDKNPVCPLVMFPTGLTLLSWPDIAHLKGT